MKLLFLLLALLPLQALPRTSWAESKKLKAESAYKSIPIYETDFSDKPFLVVGKVHVNSSSLKDLPEKMRKAAAKYGGDAVISYKTKMTGEISWWTGGQISYAEGIVVRYDSQGVTRISSDTAMQVLE